MGRTKLIIVSDDHEAVENARAYAQSRGQEFQVYSTSEWKYNLEDPAFRQKMSGEVPSLSTGAQSMESGAKILPFPGQSIPSGHGMVDDKKVKTINELESMAIENAIYEYNGNLTEAAKALGIGRATLYRKVKQYNIDPSMARRKRAA